MGKNELHAQLAKKVDNCWSAYVDRLLKLSPSAIISMADEIAAADFCYNQLTACADRYPDELLEHLLRFNDPLDAMREQWQEAQEDMDFNDAFEQAMWNLQEYGPEPEHDPDGMTME